MDTLDNNTRVELLHDLAKLMGLLTLYESLLSVGCSTSMEAFNWCFSTLTKIQIKYNLDFLSFVPSATDYAEAFNQLHTHINAIYDIGFEEFTRYILKVKK